MNFVHLIQRVAHTVNNDVVRPLDRLVNPKQPAPPQSQQQEPQHPNFLFKSTNPAPGHEGWQFLGGHSPIETPKVQLPQNIEPSHDWSIYSDPKGNSWYENDVTGERRPYQQVNSFDSQLTPHNPLFPAQPHFRPMTQAPVQYIDPARRAFPSISV
jgi:hypothetical protein